MHPSFLKSKIFALLALVIMSVSFTFPMIAFHGTLNKIHEVKSDEHLLKLVLRHYLFGLAHWKLQTIQK